MYISIDIGGTNTRVAGALDLDHPVLINPIRYRNHNNYETDIQAIVAAVHTIAGDQPVQAAGIGLVGGLNKTKDIVLSSNNNPAWKGKPFAQDLTAQIGCQVIADGDATATALGEHYYGSSHDPFAYIIWGTGVGGVLIDNDSAGNAVVNKIGWDQYFGKWEEDCGGRRLANQYGKPTEQFTEAEWRKVLDKFAEHAHIFVAATHPKSMVFGGGLSQTHSKEIEALSDVLGIRCRVSSFNHDEGLYGGFALIKQHANRGGV